MLLFYASKMNDSFLQKPPKSLKPNLMMSSIRYADIVTGNVTNPPTICPNTTLRCFTRFFKILRKNCLAMVVEEREQLLLFPIKNQRKEIHLGHKAFNRKFHRHIKSMGFSGHRDVVKNQFLLPSRLFGSPVRNN